MRLISVIYKHIYISSLILLAMSFLWEPAFISEPDILSDRRVFPSLELAKKYCDKNEYCKYIRSMPDRSGEFVAWLDYNNSIMESSSGISVLKKRDDKLLTDNGSIISIDKGELSAELILDKLLKKSEKIKLQTIAESESNCLTIIYKCSKEADKDSLNFEGGEIYKVVYSTNPFVDVSKLGLETGDYICRLIFFIESKDELVRLGLYVPFTQVVLWMDNEILQIAGNDKDTMVDKEIKMLEGVHCIFIDFGVDSKKITVDDGSALAVVPLIKGESMPSYSAISKDNYLYERNPLLLSILLKKNKQKLLENGKCDARNFYKDVECIMEMDNGLDCELSEQVMKQFEEELAESVPDLSVDLKSLIAFVYGGGVMDYSTARFMKDKIESLFINKFLNMSWGTGDIAMFSFLLPLMSPLYHNYILRTEVINKCSDVESSMYKDGFCRLIESDITMTSRPDTMDIINEIVDRRDYIYCTSRHGIIYNFELNDKSTVEKCNRVVGDEKIKNYLLSSKCSDVEGRWLGIDSCKRQGEMESGSAIAKDRDRYYRDVFLSKDNLYKFYKGEDVEQLSDFLNYASSENSNIGDEFIMSEPLMEVCDNDEEFTAECDQVYNYILSKEKTAVRDKATISLKKQNANKCSRSLKEGAVEGCDTNIMFDTSDPVSTLLYASNVNKYCERDPFNSACVNYYENVFNDIISEKNKVNMASSIENREYAGVPTFNITTVFYFILFLVSVVVIVFVFRKFSVSNRVTRFIDRITTNTMISTNM